MKLSKAIDIDERMLHEQRQAAVYVYKLQKFSTSNMICR